MKYAVAYCRSACEPSGGPSAVRRQAEAVRRHARRLGLAIREVYMDAGASDATLERPELQRLIADCRDGRIGTIVTRNPDRLSRDTG